VAGVADVVERPRVALVVLCTASFMAVVDTTIVSIALPSIRHELGFSPAGVQWVLNAYTLVFGGLLLLCGRLGDLYGRRRLFLTGLLVFAVGSVLAAAAGQPWLLIAGRAVQGVGAAAFVPASLSLLTATFTEQRARSRALGAYGAMAALGFVVGMVGGGVITQLWGWRWIFLVALPVIMIPLLPARRVLPESREPAGPRWLDVLGALTVTAGAVLVILGLTSAAQHGWLSAITIGSCALGIAALLAFGVVERRHPAPLVPPGVVTRRAVLVPNGAITLLSMVGVAWLYVLTLWFQEVLGKDALVSGLLFAPMTVASVLAAAVAGPATDRFGVRATASAGLLLVAAGLAVMAVGMGGSGSVSTVIAGMVVGEAGFMLASVPLTVAGTAGIDDEQAGLAAGLLNSSMQLGNGWGLGIVAAVVAATAAAAGPADAGSLRWGLVTCLGFCVPALLLTAAGLPRRSPAERAARAGRD
jgi:EmrB/QacA subfamily drug resistance transporter